MIRMIVFMIKQVSVMHATNVHTLFALINLKILFVICDG